MAEHPIAITEAERRIAACISPLPSETVATEEALGRTIARAVLAPRTHPAADNSAMDGFAVDATSLARGTPAPVLPGSALAGIPWRGSLPRGAAVRIATGALIPEGANAVIPLERARTVGDDVLFDATPRIGDHVRPRGEEYVEGDPIIERGRTIGPAALGLLASAGIRTIEAHRRPRVTLIVTGDELIYDAEDARGPEAIFDANTPLVRAALANAGIAALRCIRTADAPEALVAALDAALGDSDLILSTGGASVGPMDPVAAAWETVGIATIFWKVAIRPGKPVRFGLTRGGLPVFALPGNPGAALTGIERFILPVIATLGGRPSGDAPTIRMPLAAPTNDAGVPRVVRGEIVGVGGDAAFAPAPSQGSGMLRGAANANANALIPTGHGPRKGYPLLVHASPEALHGRTLRIAEPFPRLLSITGRSGSGKTRLIEQLVLALTAEGQRVGVLKRATHGPDFDRPGKDSYRHAAAGAVCNGVVGREVAMLRFNHTTPEDPFPWVERMLGHLDLVLLEGFSGTPLPRVRIETASPASPNGDFTLHEGREDDLVVWTLTRPPGEGPLTFPDAIVSTLARSVVAPDERPTPDPGCAGA